jgi:hypothetical protein
MAKFRRMISAHDHLRKISAKKVNPEPDLPVYNYISNN